MPITLSWSGGRFTPAPPPLSCHGRRRAEASIPGEHRPDAPRRGRATLGLLFATVLLPLAVTALGVWEHDRAAEDVEEMTLRRGQVAKAVALLEARPALPGERPDYGASFRYEGRNYGGPLALEKAREALDDAEGNVALAGWRSRLPPVVVVSAGLVAALSVLALAAAALLGRAGRRSREALVRGFGLVRRVLPPLLGAQVLLSAIAFVAAVAFESMAILEAGTLSSGGAKLLGIAAVAIGASLWGTYQALAGLRRTLGLFTPDPLPVQGRPVTREEAPGLWRMLDSLGGRLGALLPDNVVVGLTGGFYVASGPKVLEPGGAALPGRTLYLPLPFLPLLREDEVAAIIGHELAHFSGGDTEYSLRFLPIYAGVGRSLDAVAAAGTGNDGSVSPLMRPALRLGDFVMERFHHAVRHWSRQREFAADAAGAGATSADASARALLRTAAVLPRIDAVLGEAYRKPGEAPPDLVAAALRRVAERGADDPSAHLEEEQPHPTDTHPPTRQRIAALDRPLDAALLAEAAAPPPEDALHRLSDLFADPAGLSARASADFTAAARADARAEHAALEAAAAGVSEEEMALHENTRTGGRIVAGCGGVVLLAALGFLAVALQDGGDTVLLAVTGGLALLSGALVLYGLSMARRGDKPFLILRPDAMAITGLDRPIAWEDVADLDMTLDRGGIVTRVLLPPEATLPARLPGARRVKLDAKRRIVTFTAAAPRGLKVQDFADLIGRYRQAALARRILAQEARRDDAGHVTGA